MINVLISMWFDIALNKFKTIMSMFHFQIYETKMKLKMIP